MCHVQKNIAHLEKDYECHSRVFAEKRGIIENLVERKLALRSARQYSFTIVLCGMDVR